MNSDKKSLKVKIGKLFKLLIILLVLSLWFTGSLMISFLQAINYFLFYKYNRNLQRKINFYLQELLYSRKFIS